MSDRTAANNAPPAATLERNARPQPGTLSDRVRSLRLPDSADRRRGKPARLPWLLCLVLAGGLGYVSYQLYQLKQAQPAEAAQAGAGKTAGDARPGGTAAPAGRSALTAPGYIIPVRKVQVSPKVGGQIVQLNIVEGQKVKEGEIIAALDDAKYRFQRDRMQAMVGQFKAEYDRLKNGNREEEKKQTDAAWKEAVASLNLTRTELARAERSAPAATALELDTLRQRLIQGQFKVTQLEQVNKMMQDGPRHEDLERAKKSYENALAQLADAQYDLDNCQVKAPVSGIVLEKKAEVGNTVLPNVAANGLSGTLCDMMTLEEDKKTGELSKQLEVDVDVSERDLPSVWKDQACEIRTEAFPDRVYKGSVSRLMPVANRSKASVAARVTIQVDPDDNLIRPEMRARVVFLNPEKADKNAKTGR